MATQPLKTILALAFRCHLQGQLAEAETSYRQALALDPRQPDALHMLGVLARQKGDLTTARALIEQAVRERPAYPEAFHDLGLVLWDLGQPQPAIDAYRRAVALKPDFVDACYNLGNLFYAKGNLAEAAIWYAKALEIEPRLAPAHFNLAVIAHRQNDLASAIAGYERAVACQPDYFEALLNLGLARKEAGDFELAAQALERVAAMRLPSVAVLHALGVIRRQQGRLPEAESLSRRAIALEPSHLPARLELVVILDEVGKIEEALTEIQTVAATATRSPEVHSLLGALLKKQKRWKEAEASLRRALELDPGNMPAFTALAELSVQRGDLDSSAAYCEAAAQANPNDPSALFYLAIVRYAQSRTTAAAQNFAEVLRLDPRHELARLNLGLCQLRLGDYQSGFANYEARWKTPNADGTPRQPLRRPWKGESLLGKTLLLRSEQGFGDSIQFVRFAATVARQGARVLLECQPQVAALLATAKGIDQVIPKGQPLPPFDLESTLMSLPRILDITLETLPKQAAYLSAPNSAARIIAPAKAGQLNVGLVWAGNPRHVNDASRSLRLAEFTRWFALPTINFHSLQTGPAIRQLDDLPSREKINNLSGQLVDFSATARVIESLDLIISVDTAVAHLAGAMGKPIWLLVSFSNDWRWGEGTEVSPWYPTMRIFRQPKLGNWSEPIAQIADLLAKTSHS